MSQETETTPVPVATETPAEAVETTTPAQTPAPAAPTPFDPNTLAPEAKTYFEKQYEGHGKFKEMAQEYERLLRSTEFQQFYQGLRQPAQPAQAPKFELSDEQFVGALGNKEQFLALVNHLAEKVAAEKLGPQLQQTRQEMELSKRTVEIERTIKEHPDFMELDKRGLIEPILRKYQNISFEDAYWLAKRNVFNEEVDKKARGIVAEKKGASVERPGNPPGGRSQRVHAKTRLEAMEIAAAAHREGREIPDIEID